MNFDLIADIFAIIGRGLYGNVDPARFGNLAKACFTLFQLITLDDWFFMYSDVRDTYPSQSTDSHQFCHLYYIPHPQVINTFSSTFYSS